MALPNYIGLQTLDNSWNAQSAHRIASGGADSMVYRMYDEAGAAGANLARVPLDMAYIGGNPNTIVSQDVLSYFNSELIPILQEASQNAQKLILQPAQTPLDLLPDYLQQQIANGQITFQQAVSHPPAIDKLDEYASRFAQLANLVHNSEFSDVVIAWEVGNEPNLGYSSSGGFNPNTGDWNAIVDSESGERPYSVDLTLEPASTNGLNAAQEYALMLHKVAEALSNEVPVSVQVMAAGIAHNDTSYMSEMLEYLSDLRDVHGSYVDSFAIHPYTAQGFPGSGDSTASRPTDLPDDNYDKYFSFELAVENYSNLLNTFGYSNAGMWVTEFGVPSYLGGRGAEGLIDANGDASRGEIAQAQFYAEAFGVFGSWGYLQGITAHQTHDNYLSGTGTSAVISNDDVVAASSQNGPYWNGEGSYGVYALDQYGNARLKASGEVLQAISSQSNYFSNSINLLFQNNDGTRDAYLNLNNLGLESQIILTFDGNDTVVGTSGHDSIFGGDGSDTIDGGGGNDRLYGGLGDDLISGSNGNDAIDGGAGNDRLDGGAGSDYYSYNRGEGFDEIIEISDSASTDKLFINGYQHDTLIIGRSVDGNDLVIRFPNSANSSGYDGQIIVRGQFSGSIGEGLELINFDDGRISDGTAVSWDRQQIETYSVNNIIDIEDTTPPSPTNNVITDTLNSNEYIYGTANNDIFVINGNSSDYTWKPTDNNVGTVVFPTIQGSVDVHDILDHSSDQFDQIQFSDRTVALLTEPTSPTTPPSPTDNIIIDDPSITQHLFGTTANDVFTIDGISSDYSWEPTEDGTGSVVYLKDQSNGNIPDILYHSTEQFDQIQFTDRVITLLTEPTSPQTNNIVNGDDNNNDDYTGQVKGTDGNDVIDAMAGDDVIWASAGNDIIEGGTGDDVLDILGAGSLSTSFTIIQNSNGSYILESAAFGTDTLTGVEHVWFEDDDVYIDLPVGGSPNFVTGTVNDDNLIIGSDGNDEIDALAGNDAILASAGDDIIDGGAGTDVLDVTGTGNTVSNFTVTQIDSVTFTVSSVAYGTDTLTNVENIWFEDGDFISSLQDLADSSGGGESTDTITGTSGSDVFVSTAANEVFDGGDGTDYLDYLGDNALVAKFSVTQNNNGTYTIISAEYGVDVISNIEEIYFDGEADDNDLHDVQDLLNRGDSIVYNDTAQNEELQGNDGSNVFVIDGLSTEFGWGDTENGLGTVVWNSNSTENFDLLYDYEFLAFNDTIIEIGVISA